MSNDFLENYTRMLKEKAHFAVADAFPDADLLVDDDQLSRDLLHQIRISLFAHKAKTILLLYILALV